MALRLVGFMLSNIVARSSMAVARETFLRVRSQADGAALAPSR
jgi:hypothetical protein